MSQRAKRPSTARNSQTACFVFWLRSSCVSFGVAGALSLGCLGLFGQAHALRVEISCPKTLCVEPSNGRAFLILAPDDKVEPRFAVNDQPGTAQFFGVDVDGFSSSKSAFLDSSTLGYPLDNLNMVPPGEYFVQGLFNVYETFHRADDRVLKLPMDHGEGQQWNRKPGNLFSKPLRIHIGTDDAEVVHIELTEKIPPIIEAPQDTRYVKHVRLHSELLSRFWGRPMEIGAVVLLPDGWDDHPEARYPLLVDHRHYTPDLRVPVEFRTTRPTQDLKGDARFLADFSYKFYQDWTSGRLPRVLILMLQTPNPYYDDAYGINSANVGPYGDAIVKEVIPEVEKRFRGIGAAWARATYGASTGGWAALAMQIFYPDEFNGSWGLCPDPVDFRAYQLVNLYDDKNALWIDGPFSRIPRPYAREVDGTVTTTIDRENRRELVLGTRGRSTDQLGIWQAVFSPVGQDGYPEPIWDPVTGVIDHKVAAFWRDHYDLRFILERDWKTLGPGLVGKLHITVGTRDSNYLDNAVRLMEDFLKNTNNPYYAGDIEYGPHQPHCFTGDAQEDLLVGAMTVVQRILPKAVAWMERTAPAGADLKSWKY